MGVNVVSLETDAAVVAFSAAADQIGGVTLRCDLEDAVSSPIGPQTATQSAL